MDFELEDADRLLGILPLSERMERWRAERLGLGRSGPPTIKVKLPGIEPAATELAVAAGPVLDSPYSGWPSMLMDGSENPIFDRVTLLSPPLLPTDAVWKKYVDGAVEGQFLPLDGSAPMAGALTLSADAAQPLHAVPLQQLNSAITGATVGGPFLPLTGGTVTGNTSFTGTTVTVGAPANAQPQLLVLQAVAGQERTFRVYTGSTPRWAIGADPIAEAGGNSGSQFNINAWNDAGTFVGNIMQGVRGSGPGGLGHPYISSLAPYIMTAPRATTPGGVIGNDQAFPTTGADVQPVTPLGTNPLATTSGSAVVNVTWTGCGASSGVFAAGMSECYVNLLGATAVGGITPTGWLKGARVDNDHFSVTWTSNATSTATGGGVAVTVQPNFVAIGNKDYAVMTGSTAGFPIQYERLYVANPAFYKTIASGTGNTQYQQEYRQVYGPPDPSGLNNWGIIGTEMDLINRGKDAGYAPNLFGALNPSIGFWIGSFNVGVPGFATGGGTVQNWNTVFSVFSFGNTGNYTGYSVQPNALVGAANDPTAHGGVSFVSYGAYSSFGVNGMSTTSGTSTVTFNVVLGMAQQVNGGSVYIPTVTTLNGVTVGGGSYVMSGVTATSFQVAGTGTASATGSGGAAQSIYFANLVPYAPMEFRGSYKHGINTTEFRSEDGSIIHTQPGNGIVWDDGTGTAAITGTLISPGVINATISTGGTARATVTATGINSTAIGATTPSTGAFTNLSATGTITGAGSFTTLAASGAVSGAGFTAFMASPPAIGSTAAGTASFTTATVSGAGNALTVTNNVAAQGGVQIGTNIATSPFMAINGAATNARNILFQTAGLNRWRISPTLTAEGGSNAGSDFQIGSYTDAGGALGNVLTILRSSGMVFLSFGLSITGNVGFNGTAAIAKPAVSGSRGGNAAVASLLTALASYGLITDSSTA